MSTPLWEDPRVRRGMEMQLAARRTRLAAGEHHLGWKLGFGAPAALQKFGIPSPLSGFMTDRNRLSSGAHLSFAGWVKPVAETEIAVYLGRDLPAGASREVAAAAIAAIGPAIEIVDLDTPPAEIEPVLACNIYHRHVVLGSRDETRSGAKLDGLTGRVFRNGEEFASASDLQANTGEILKIVPQVAALLAAFGERVRAGDVIICGAVVPPIELKPEDREIAFELAPGLRVEARIG